MFQRSAQLRAVSQRMSFRQIVTVLAVCLLLYNEFLCYIISSWTWPHLHANRDGNDEIRALFVADPQLIGLRNEPPLLGYLSRWDSDRYLSHGFQQAVGFLRPNVVIFLGDLLDEGSSGSNEDFVSYVDRFNGIFKTPGHVQRIFVAGDNDVGGEGVDRKAEWKVKRFQRHFNMSSDVSTVNFVDFFRISADFGEEISHSTEEEWSKARQQSSAPFRVILNHMTLLSFNVDSYAKIVRIFEPHLLVTAHTHLARFYKCSDCRSPPPRRSSRRFNQPLAPFAGEILDLSYSGPVGVDLTDTKLLHELTVPTCSYRMGVPKMGFGASVIRRDGKMEYGVLWLPSRYYQLATYIIFACVVLLKTLFNFCLMVLR